MQNAEDDIWRTSLIKFIMISIVINDYNTYHLWLKIFINNFFQQRYLNDRFWYQCNEFRTALLKLFSWYTLMKIFKLICYLKLSLWSNLSFFSQRNWRHQKCLMVSYIYRSLTIREVVIWIFSPEFPKIQIKYYFLYI